MNIQGRVWLIVSGYKTTMTTGEWSCLISFAWAPLSCSERRGSEKFKMKIYVSSGIRTHATPPMTGESALYKALYIYSRSMALIKYRCFQVIVGDDQHSHDIILIGGITGLLILLLLLTFGIVFCLKKTQNNKTSTCSMNEDITDTPRIKIFKDIDYNLQRSKQNLDFWKQLLNSIVCYDRLNLI